MGESGILTEEDHVELLEGWVVEKMIHRPPHDAVVELAETAIRSLIPPGWRIRIQSAITTEDSEPEPDLAIVSGSIRDHLNHHPKPHEIGLVIEVADSSLARDRAKARLYARAGIAIYWIINLTDSRLEVFLEPDRPSASYQAQKNYISSDSVPLIISGLEVGRIPVSDMLP